jgi:hypothetical protein
VISVSPFGGTCRLGTYSLIPHPYNSSQFRIELLISTKILRRPRPLAHHLARLITPHILNEHGFPPISRGRRLLI